MITLVVPSGAVRGKGCIFSSLSSNHGETDQASHSSRMTASPAPSAISLTWQCTPFDRLAPHELYAAMELRQRVFVFEQNCPYMDADGADEDAQHLFGWRGTDGQRQLVAYARLFPPGTKYAEASIGRVVTHPEARGSGAGRELMAEAIRVIEEAGWGAYVKIAAQMYLEKFYGQFGFRRVSEPYTEDNIWHVDMLRVETTGAESVSRLGGAEK